MPAAIMPILPWPAARPAPATTVFLPKEHGSWSLALEPLALGLLVAPSLAGGALAGVVLSGFFARRPLKLALARRRQAVAENVVSSPRTMNDTFMRFATARRALTLLMILAAVAMVEVLVLAPWSALWPLLPAAALGVIFARLDAQGESRAVAAELAGCTAFTFVPAALATLAGLPGAVALALAFLAAARSLPAILIVRSYLRTTKGEPVGAAAALWTAVSALAGSVALVAAGLAPGIAVVLGTGLLLRTAWLASPARPAWPARRIGMMEALLGLLYVGAIAAAYRV